MQPHINLSKTHVDFPVRRGSSCYLVTGLVKDCTTCSVTYIYESISYRKNRDEKLMTPTVPTTMQVITIYTIV